MEIVKTKITDVFFDLDHTLWDFEKNSALAFETIFKKHQINLNVEEFLSHYVPINLRYWEMYRSEQITQTQLRYGRLKDAFDLMSFEIDDERILFLSDQYVYYLPKYNHLLEGTIEILEYLKPKYKLHIITNGFAEIQNNKLNNANINQYFQTITNSEMAGVKKPNPLIFQHALDLAQAQKGNSIMIGDCIEADIYGALRSGFDAVLFNENHLIVDENIKQIHHLLELKKYL
ncbi:YjjG family noncanonical pyrimidine nucleotidase [Flavobacterium psychrotolerans]|uniref:Noncanonical pyrimidine nucleotidase, YjjG family n=1 Tax=Flavobacterium psychrotolerans TaxID=2169410 RepID=A0A2U1JJA6_9FLAO|nr:YjjG family noncanonical pyrimidine nucleotidase [Flavobacterium psychrotolerans]PWA04943.1 noncanonical pyrimidine nucleotidase, YjjG family [Flavobacterium psychrotolerans]